MVMDRLPIHRNLTLPSCALVQKCSLLLTGAHTGAVFRVVLHRAQDQWFDLVLMAH
ncbi:hypothetical protein KIN20_001559 [Parelaphostrongylus tenuis]|uniref:Uncharacterized protein n=1 Tax=Parelaphostrongylus tenuis TaxID=148309 RepID=A0AAD5LX54_PARTN|nr:hypothetical protein KIN20_001559 [Parelaphostrongylus tenuis]